MPRTARLAFRAHSRSPPLTFLYVAAGGALGAVARYAVAALAAGWGGAFPWGTLAVNFAGSLALGYFVHALPGLGASPELRAFLTVGFCGGFTTFSTFGYETAILLQGGMTAAALLYVGASVLLSVAGVLVGVALGG